jgi:hypothetical protein
MTRLLKTRIFWPICMCLFVLLLAAHTAYAHESRMVGPYQFVVGFITEPAFEGQKNGVSLRITEGEGEDAVPVEGVEETLQVEVTHVPSGASQTMELRAIFGDPGHYTNDWIPTAPGQYRFHFTGTVEDTTVDEVFESGPDTFGSVQPVEELYFPEAPPAARELESAVRGAEESADEALNLALAFEEQVGTIQTLATASLVLGLIALVVAAAALGSARRR